MVEEARVLDVAIAGISPAVEKVVVTIIKEGLVPLSQIRKLIEVVELSLPEYPLKKSMKRREEEIQSGVLQINSLRRSV